MADAERIPCNGLFYAMARNALHGLFLPVRISMYACTLAVTNPDTVKRICSTLCCAALRPARNVAGACFRFRPRCAGALLCGLCSCRLLCACSYRGMKRTFHKAFTKIFLHKKKPPCGGLVYSLNARVSSGHNVAALMRIRLSVSLTAC